MKEKTLLNISLICSLAGLIILYYILSTAEIPASNDINETQIDKKVSLTGEISNVQKRDNLVFFELKYDKRIPVVAFDNETELRDGQKVRIIGKVTEYDNG